MNAEYKIDKNIPFPEKKRTAWPFAKMDVGDSFLITTDQYVKVYAAASYHGQRNNKKFQVKKVPEGYRVWRTV